MKKLQQKYYSQKFRLIHPEYNRNYIRSLTPEKKEARRRMKQEWHNKTYPNRRLIRLFKRYNLPEEKYKEIIDLQNWRCACCGEIPTPDSQSSTGFHIDHDHNCCPGSYSCGRCIRGILCGDCNRGLGCFKDSIIKLTQALEYLEKHEKTTTDS